MARAPRFGGMETKEVNFLAHAQNMGQEDSNHVHS
jgi:hypothetical protein